MDVFTKLKVTDWILIVTIAVCLSVAIPTLIDNHKRLKKIEKYYGNRKK